MAKVNLKVEKRNFLGRKVKRLRKEGKLPGNIYGSDIKSVSIEVFSKDFATAYASAGETSVVELALEKDVYPVLIHNIQLDPITSKPLHVDFLKIDLKKKVTANIPLVIVGEAPAEKQGLGTLVSYIDEVEVEALPGDLLDKIEVNVESLVEADQSLSIKDLHYDKDKLTITNDPETIVLKIEVQKEEPVEEVKPVEEGVVAEGGAPIEGEVPTEGGESEEPVKEEKPQEK